MNHKHTFDISFYKSMREIMIKSYLVVFRLVYNHHASLSLSDAQYNIVLLLGGYFQPTLTEPLKFSHFFSFRLGPDILQKIGFELHQ
jgi:hypothetical protein